ncbi:MAG: OmpA family protein [Chlorobi bacterium]|nr:OmpA family protein [Chlorobiota bacterium]
MKYTTAILISFFLFFAITPAQGQIGRLLKKEAEKKTGKTIGKILGNKKKPAEEEKKTDENQPAGKQEAKPESTPKNELSWAKYDFVPGDEVIFEDNLEDEENGEFPSRWDLVRGNVEIAQLNGENVIMLRDGEPSIIPYLKNPEADYLPEIFTIGMDLYYPGSGIFKIYLYDRKNQKSGSPTGYTAVEISGNEMEFGQARSRYPSANLPKSRWIHIAIAYTKGKLKAYMDDTRLINLPRIDFDPRGITLYTYHASNDNLFYVKNVRIAKGGVKYYDRFIQDGKIIASGIRFETGKADVLPESMGIINEIYNLMTQHPEVRISVEGHTDDAGDDAMNQALSEKRAEAVRSKLVSMGIDASRLASKGWGESKPVTDNSTPEGRANNRRVEFVKL